MIAVTQGDASGVGPEIILAAAAAGDPREPFVVFGDMAVLSMCREKLGIDVAVRAVRSVEEYAAGAVNVLDFAMLRPEDVTPGRISKAAGAAARAYVVAAAEAALAGRVRAMVTLPMNKEATQLSDPVFTGHTELIGEVCGVEDVTILLVSGQLAVSHVSTHVSLQEAIRRVTKERVETIIRLTCDAVTRLRGPARVAVAGLNPHAGESGLAVEGPHPPDTLFYLAVRRNKYDAVVCMYHDQGHIPMKLLDFESAVNVTLGLPIVRTSVDHGTAFDIAWQGKANPQSYLEAFALAVRMTSDTV
jgi:4-phospho-D-threonate 3-dehydrogenase / 4-phospho-D-erythronate 3-dehydrogenase